MRIAAVILFLTSACFCASGQEQENKFMERLYKPDRSQASLMNGKKYSPGGSDLNQKYHGSKDTYYGLKKADTSAFSQTRSFLGIKNPWLGGKVYKAKGAYLGDHVVPNIDRKFATDRATSKDYYSANRKAYFDNGQIPLKPFLVQGGAQGAINKMSEKMNKELSIDDVRELLNKNR